MVWVACNAAYREDGAGNPALSTTLDKSDKEHKTGMELLTCRFKQTSRHSNESNLGCLLLFRLGLRLTWVEQTDSGQATRIR